MESKPTKHRDPKSLAWLLQNGRYFLSKNLFGFSVRYIEKTNWEQFEALQKHILLTGYDIDNPINLSLLHSLYVVLKRCRAYHNLVQEFISRHYYILGPRLSIVLSTHFISKAIEEYRLVYKGDIRRLIYMLQPTKVHYSIDALAFDKRLEISDHYKNAMDEFNRQYPGCSIQQYRRFALLEKDRGETVWGITGMDEGDPRADQARKSMEKIVKLSQQLESIHGRIDKEKKKTADWLEIATQVSSSADHDQVETLKTIAQSNYSGKRPDINFCEDLVNFLRENKMLYEASCFCDTWADIFKDFILPQRIKAIMTRSRADFLKLAYRRSLQTFGEQTSEKYEVEGPVYLILQNGIAACDVNFLIVGPTVEQITLAPSDQTSFEIKPGRYTVVCEPKQWELPPLILEGNCEPGKQYPIGIAVVQQDGFQAPPPISEMGSGFSINTGLFGALADIDPKYPLELQYGGRRYRIKNYLGEGSGGIVYQAINEETRGVSAFKFMTTDLLGGRNQIEFGRKEWQTYTSLVSKQNVTAILSYSEDLAFFQQSNEKPKKKMITAYQMEYAEYGNLRSYIERKKEKPSLKEIMSIIKQISAGLESIHSSGLLHRDIRPENVLVFKSFPKYRICDFTLTRSKKELIAGQLKHIFSGETLKVYDQFIERRTASTLQSFRQIIGSSTFYSAPEEHGGYSNGDARSDLFSVGCILYWLLVGLEPFELLLRDKYHNLYERYKIAMDQQIFRLDFQHKKALFGNLNQLEGELRNAGLSLKKEDFLEIDIIELEHSKVRETFIASARDFISKTINPDPNKRFQSVGDMRHAIDELERAV